MEISRVLKCSDCSKPLLNILIFKTNNKINKVQATCPYCMGQSQVEEFDGRYFTSGISIEESRSPTSIGDVKTENDRIIIFMKKGSK